VTGGPLAFGANKVGTPSTQSVTLTNTGAAPMVVGAATASGPFTASQTCASPLAVGASCTVSATYTPTVLGAESGSLTIAHPGALSGDATSVALTGSGTIPSAALSDTVLEFGNIKPGAVSPQLTLRLTNTGNAVMVVGAPSVTGPFALESSDCPAALAPAGFCRVAVTFRPTGLGSAPGTLRVPNDASPGGAALVAVHGVGAPVAPAAPTGVKAVRGNGSALVSWVAPDNGGQDITAYDVFALSSSGAVRTVRVNGAARSQVLATLTNGQAYQFQVSAINGVGAGPRSALSAAVVPATRASAPQILTAKSGKAGGKITATAAWIAPRTNGGARITSYRVIEQRISATGKVLKTTTSGAIKPSARSAALHLKAGTYRFRVVAVNGVGTSATSARSKAVRAR
jgi:Fibronectin type III domain/Abnormal spindle-like microcephaly-assoc'd, ASPM-SPD-2-Hydin